MLPNTLPCLAEAVTPLCCWNCCCRCCSSLPPAALPGPAATPGREDRRPANGAAFAAAVAVAAGVEVIVMPLARLVCGMGSLNTSMDSAGERAELLSSSSSDKPPSAVTRAWRMDRGEIVGEALCWSLDSRW